MKLELKRKAILLRKKGKSYSEILKIVGVSKGTLSLWLRNVKLNRAQHDRIYITLKQKNAYLQAKKRQIKKENETKQINKGAKKEIGEAFKNWLFLAGLMLYWAEGDKSEQVELVKFSNSDPHMIKLMMKWFRKICQVPEDKFRIGLHIHELHNQPLIEKYWSKMTGIKINQFNKTQIKESSLQYRRNMLYNGTCSIRISNCKLFRKIKAWKIAFIEKTST